MAETITITIPEAPEKREEVLRFLRDHDLLAKVPATADQPKGHWARVAENLSHANALGNGLGDEFRAGMREFRENVTFRSDHSPETSA